eukprot:10948953-Alexandrium_andersonii.AAC.1
MEVAGAGASHARMATIKALRRLAWAQTKSAIWADGLVTRGQLSYPAAPTREIRHQEPRWRASGEACPAVSVLRAEMLEVAGARARAGGNVAVLNMAAANSPGGG